MKQVFNPYLPLNEYIPDGEPHVFGDRVYVFGSHDKEGGHTFCMRDYVTYSAPVTDLTDWRYEGVIFKAKNDPKYGKIFFDGKSHESDGSPEDEGKVLRYMYAPDVVKGNDGRYYLYYCMGGEYGYGGYAGPISVAVCDRPGGEYEFLGHVVNSDGSLMMKYICFDPAVINDNGTIRLYYGTQYGYEEEEDFDSNDYYINSEVEMFGRSKEDILSYEDSIMGPVMAVLCDDMVTVKEEAKHVIPYKVKGTSFETHPFFEGSSIRKKDDIYYFVYSSWQNHELCYATSQYPDKGFIFGGTLVSNGDVGFEGRSTENKLNMTGTTHGGIECINGEWYVFYHRLTHKSDYSRQSCAEKITIKDDGSIDQVEITSCGLNGGPLMGKGRYPAVIACNLTQGQMPHGSNTIYGINFPNVTHFNDEQFIGQIENQTLIGYKYFDFKDTNRIKIRVRFENDDNRFIYQGPLRKDERCDDEERRIASFMQARPLFTGDIPYFEIRTDREGPEVGRILLLSDESKTLDSREWLEFIGDINIKPGKAPLYFTYHGNELIQFLDFELL